MNSNLHPTFAAILAPLQQRRVDLAEQAVKLNAEMLELYSNMSPEEKIKNGPMMQEYINKTARIVGRMKEGGK